MPQTAFRCKIGCITVEASWVWVAQGSAIDGMAKEDIGV